MEKILWISIDMQIYLSNLIFTKKINFSYIIKFDCAFNNNFVI